MRFSLSKSGKYFFIISSELFTKESKRSSRFLDSSKRLRNISRSLSASAWAKRSNMPNGNAFIEARRLSVSAMAADSISAKFSASISHLARKVFIDCHLYTSSCQNESSSRAYCSTCRVTTRSRRASMSSGRRYHTKPSVVFLPRAMQTGQNICSSE